MTAEGVISGIAAIVSVISLYVSLAQNKQSLYQQKESEFLKVIGRIVGTEPAFELIRKFHNDGISRNRLELLIFMSIMIENPRTVSEARKLAKNNVTMAFEKQG